MGEENPTSAIVFPPRPITTDHYLPVKERMGSQWVKLEKIIGGLLQGTLRAEDLSLGVDPKRGIRPISDDILQKFEEFQQIAEKQIVDGKFTRGISLDSYSDTLWQKARKDKRYSWTNLTFEPSRGQSRLFINIGDLWRQNLTCNPQDLQSLARLMAAGRMTGLPIRFKANSAYEYVMYGRDMGDTVGMVLAIFNEMDENSLSTGLDTFKFRDRQENNSLEAVQLCFSMVTYPGIPYYDEYSYPLGPAISFRDRISDLGGQDPLSTYRALRIPGTALLLGRMGATARGVLEVNPGKAPHQVGLIDTDVADMAAGYLRSNKLPGQIQHRVLTSGDTITAKSADKEPWWPEVKRDTGDRKLTLFKLHDYIYGLVDWRLGGFKNNPRYLFVYRVAQEQNPLVYQACLDVISGK